MPPENHSSSSVNSDKVTGHKINTQKFLSFLYTNNGRSETDIKETIPITITLKRKIKHVGINLSKETKDLHWENCKTLMKEINMTETEGNIYHILGLEKSILLK